MPAYLGFFGVTAGPAPLIEPTWTELLLAFFPTVGMVMSRGTERVEGPRVSRPSAARLVDLEGLSETPPAGCVCT